MGRSNVPRYIRSHINNNSSNSMKLALQIYSVLDERCFRRGVNSPPWQSLPGDDIRQSTRRPDPNNKGTIRTLSITLPRTPSLSDYTIVTFIQQPLLFPHSPLCRLLPTSSSSTESGNVLLRQPPATPRRPPHLWCHNTLFLLLVNEWCVKSFECVPW